jgi:hypothetical protein
VIEKSRVPLGESTRLKINTSSGSINNTTSKTHTSSLLRSSTDPAPSDEEDSDAESDNEQTLNNLAGLNGYDRKENKQYDLEVYDDRSFYSMLLKVCSTIGLTILVVCLILFQHFTDIHHIFFIWCEWTEHASGRFGSVEKVQAKEEHGRLMLLNLV